MSVVLSEVSPLNCRWIVWEQDLPVCRRPPAGPRLVSEDECLVCEHWQDGPSVGVPETKNLGRPVTVHDDPLDKHGCPRCGSHDVVLLGGDATVQSFACSVCRQNWLESVRLLTCESPNA